MTTLKQEANRSYTKMIVKVNLAKPYITYFMIVLFTFIVAKAPQMFDLKRSTITIIGSVIVYSIIALGLNILLGYSGLISLGTAGFMGLSAYLTAYLTVDKDISFLLSFLITVIASVLVGVFVGLISLRIEGFYLAIVTLCVSEIFKLSFGMFEQFTNGFSGKKANYPTIFSHVFTKDETYILLAVVLGLLMFLMNNLINSETGRALLTMKNSEAAAQAMGINILKYRLIAFGLSTLYASIAGVLYMHFFKFTTPGAWNLSLSLFIFAVIIIGGLRSIFGTVIGSFIVFGAPDLILKKLPVIGDINGLAYVIYGILIIVVVLFYSNGIMQIWYDILKLLNQFRVFVLRLIKGVENEK